MQLTHDAIGQILLLTMQADRVGQYFESYHMVVDFCFVRNDGHKRPNSFCVSAQILTNKSLEKRPEEYAIEAVCAPDAAIFLTEALARFAKKHHHGEEFPGLGHKKLIPELKRWA